MLLSEQTILTPQTVPAELTVLTKFKELTLVTKLTILSTILLTVINVWLNLTNLGNVAVIAGSSIFIEDLLEYI